MSKTREIGMLRGRKDLYLGRNWSKEMSMSRQFMYRNRENLFETAGY